MEKGKRMENKIKYRGKRKGENEWIYGGICYINNAPFIIYEMVKGLPKIEEVEETSVGQCSTVKDKNGIDMYEGDIVYGAARWIEQYEPAMVTFRNGSFGLLWYRGNDEVFNPFANMCNIEYKIVGNIYDNPELMEKSNNELTKTKVDGTELIGDNNEKA